MTPALHPLDVLARRVYIPPGSSATGMDGSRLSHRTRPRRHRRLVTQSVKIVGIQVRRIQRQPRAALAASSDADRAWRATSRSVLSAVQLAVPPSAANCILGSPYYCDSDIAATALPSATHYTMLTALCGVSISTITHAAL